MKKKNKFDFEALRKHAEKMKPRLPERRPQLILECGASDLAAALIGCKVGMGITKAKRELHEAVKSGLLKAADAYVWTLEKESMKPRKPGKPSKLADEAQAWVIQ